MKATGTFEVRMAPSPAYDDNEGASLAHVSLDKQFHGDLVGTSHAEMISAMTEVKGSAGYVAIERFTGSLHGQSGTFVMQHSGTMTRGQASLSVSIVPDSGTAELKGVRGILTIDIVEKEHRYSLEYEIAAL